MLRDYTFTLALSAGAALAADWSFLVVGDWGYHEGGLFQSDACVRAVAKGMQGDQFTNAIDLVLNMGDNVYLDGTDDKDWFFGYWTDYFGEGLTNLPWWSVYGNHDIVGKDRCACENDADPTKVCTLVTGDTPRQGWDMPSLNYIKEHKGITFIALEQNSHDIAARICSHTTCGTEDDCNARLLKYSAASNAMLKQHIDGGGCTHDKPCVIFGHYPLFQLTDAQFQDLQNYVKDPNLSVTYFGGHLHQTVQDISASNAWVVGGGGGFDCDGGGPSGYALVSVTGTTVDVQLKPVDCSQVPVSTPSAVCTVKPNEDISDIQLSGEGDSEEQGESAAFQARPLVALVVLSAMYLVL